MAGTGEYRSLLARRSYFALWVAGGLTYGVSSAVLVVLVWTVTQAFPGLGGTAHTQAVALCLALLGLSATLPTLVMAVVSGTLADTQPRLRLMRLVNALQILALVGLVADFLARPAAPVSVPGIPAPLPLYVLLLFPLWALLSAAATLFRPALNASLPRVVASAELRPANGLLLAFALTTNFAGALAAPALLELRGAAAALAVPLSFVVVAQAAFGLVDAALDPERRSAPRAFGRELAEGYRFLAGQPALLRITLGGLALNFLSNLAFVELGLYVTVILGASQPIYLGILYAGASVGAALGSLAATRIRFEPRAGRYLTALAFAQGATVLALAAIRWYPFAAIDLFLYGVVPGMAVTIFYAVVQATVRNELLGRVLAADEVGSLSLLPAGQYAGGIVTAEFGVPFAFTLAGVGILLTGVGFAASSSVRRLGFRPSAPARPPGAIQGAGAEPGPPGVSEPGSAPGAQPTR